MPDALTKSITVPGWGALVKVSLATPCDSHPEGLLRPSFLCLSWKRPLWEVPMAANLLLPQKSGLECSSCLSTWMVSWLWPSTYFLMLGKTVTNVMSPLCGVDAWAGLSELGWSRCFCAVVVVWTEGSWRLPVLTSATPTLAQVMLILLNTTPVCSAGPKLVPQLTQKPTSWWLLIPPC